MQVTKNLILHMFSLTWSSG